MALHDPGSSALLTDFYQLTMLKSYFDRGMTGTAAFEFFVRKLPPQRNFLVAAGLEPVLAFLEGLQFTPTDLEWLAARPGFPPAFIDALSGLHFNGDVDALAEGTVFFPDEPILRIVASLPLAQLVETRVIALLHFSSLVASKAARMVLAAPEKLLVDFGLRRAHGAEAGLLAARSAYIAGFNGTATVLAGKRYDIPLYGTMAHSFIQAHENENEAFADFARDHPENTTLLIDTYDTESAARKIVKLVRLLRKDGLRIKAVRLDSGDLAEHARKVRRILDEGGCSEISIFASGGLDENELARLRPAPIDGFGVGTSLVTSSDAPALDCAYKLQEYAGVARRKRSEGKATWPGRKQIFRSFDTAGLMKGDLLALAEERGSGTPLLEPVMRGGQRVAPPPTLVALRQRAGEQMHRLPEVLKRLGKADQSYPVDVSPALVALAGEVDRHIVADFDAGNTVREAPISSSC